MALDQAKNFAKVTVSTGYNASDTSVVLAAGDGAKLPTAPFNAVWFNATDYPDPSDDPNREIVRVTAVSTDTLTVTRAQEGTTASTKNTAGKAYRMIAGLTAATANRMLDKTGDTLPLNAQFFGPLIAGVQAYIKFDDAGTGARLNFYGAFVDFNGINAVRFNGASLEINNGAYLQNAKDFINFALSANSTNQLRNSGAFGLNARYWNTATVGNGDAVFTARYILTSNSSNQPKGRIAFTFFDTEAFSNIEALSLLNTGELGIGTNNPLTKLHVKGSIFADSTGNVGEIFVNGATTSIYRMRVGGVDKWHFEASGSSFRLVETGVDYRLIVLPGGNIGFSVENPTATLHLRAGAAAAGKAPLKFTAGVNLTTPESGAVEFDGSHLYITIGTTRHQLDQQGGSSKPFLQITAAQLDSTNTGDVSMQYNRKVVVAGTNYFTAVMPATYGGGGITVDVYAVVDADTDTGHNLNFGISFEREETGLNITSDSFAAEKTSAAQSLSATVRVIMKFSVAFTNSEIDGITAGDLFRIKVTKQGSATGSVYIMGISIRET